MRIAAIYWPTSSVGGINTELRVLRQEADRRGDVFHVLRSGKHKSLSPCVFAVRKVIRGGDTNITIDGELPHHQDNVQASLDFLHANYDRVYFAYMCPHPTKDYGDEPLFLPLYRDCLLPIASRITDGYWESYKEWGELCLKHCDFATIVHRAAMGFFEGKTTKVTPVRTALFMKDCDAEREAKPLTVWTSQWKAIKGIHKLFPVLPQIKHRVEMYSNGILYYQMRLTPEWQMVVGRDHFSEAHSGIGDAEFFGCVPLDDIPTILRRSWFMIDLMGIGNPRNKLYQNGTHNNTAIEALWYGSCPVLHKQASKIIPDDIALFVERAEEIPKLLNAPSNQRFACDAVRIAKAKKWVLTNYNPENFYNKVILGTK